MQLEYLFEARITFIGMNLFRLPIIIEEINVVSFKNTIKKF